MLCALNIRCGVLFSFYCLIASAEYVVRLAQRLDFNRKKIKGLRRQCLVWKIHTCTLVRTGSLLFPVLFTFYTSNYLHCYGLVA